MVLLLDDVDPRLVLVHGVQDDLQTTNTANKHTRLRSASAPIDSVQRLAYGGKVTVTHDQRFRLDFISNDFNTVDEK